MQNQILDGTDPADLSPQARLERGNYGEIRTDQFLRELGYERISLDGVTDLKGVTHHGIDGVYFNPDGHPQYLIVEVKFGSATLGNTLDGRQMSDNWIDKRLDAAVGKERADQIRMELLTNPENVGKVLSHVDDHGNVTLDLLGSDGNPVKEGISL